MAKPKKRRKNKNKASSPDTSPAMLATEGSKALESGNFTKAINNFKQLLKQEPCPKWQDELARAYESRARALAGKGMFKEALVILDNLAHFCPDVVPDASLLPFRVQLLLKVGRPDKAATQYGSEAQQLQGTETGSTLAELFAALILAKGEAVLTALPQDAPPVVHADYAQQALRAYCQKEKEEATRQLKQIPSRSPYRYFVLALKGLMTMESEPAAAARLFAKIPPTSPFYSLVKPFVACAARDSSLVDTLNNLSHDELQFLAAIKGFDERRSAFLMALAKVNKQPQKLMPLLCTQGKELDAQWAQSLCQRLLPLYPKGDIHYIKAFGPLPQNELYRLQALAFEHIQEWDFCLKEWEKYAKLLVSPPQTAQKQLSIALIYRHMAKIAEDLGPDVYADAEENDRYRSYLAKSLAYDSADKPTYLKLIDAYRDDKKLFQQWLDRALDQFPRDIDFLLMAAEAALKRGAFKKTSGYAERILAVDPINTKVKSLLLRAHLSHGRKLAKAEKFDAALRECVLAEEQQRSQSHLGTARICRGLVKILAGEEAQGQTLAEEGRQLVGLPCKAWLITAIEADLLKLPPGKQRKIHLQLKASAGTNLSKVEFFEFFELLKTYKQQAPRQTQRVNRFVQPRLKKSADLGFSQDESRELCDYFFQEQTFDLLQPFATVAERHWPEKPIFTFYRLYAKACANPYNLSDRDLDILDQIEDKATEQNDIFTADLIDEFILPFDALLSSPFNREGHPHNDPGKILKSILEALGEKERKDPAPKKKAAPKKVPKAPKDGKRDNDNPLKQLELF